MTTLPYFTESDISNSIDMTISIDLIEQCFTHYQTGIISMPPKVYLSIPQVSGDFRAMPVYDQSSHKAAIKWVNSHPKNTSRPSVMATMVLNDALTGQPLAVADAGLLTAIRTGASAGVATKHMARKDAQSLALIGAGIQAFYQAEAVLAVRDITTITIFDLNTEKSHTLKSKLQTICSATITIASTIENAVQSADIICTTTPSKTPILSLAQLKQPVHINAMGADGPGKQELDLSILKQATIIVDDWTQASHSGEINVPFHN